MAGPWQLPVKYYRFEGRGGAKATRLRGTGIIELSPEGVVLTDLTRTTASTIVIAVVLTAVTVVTISAAIDAYPRLTPAELALFSFVYTLWFLVVRRIAARNEHLELDSSEISQVIVDYQRRTMGIRGNFAIRGKQLPDRWLGLQAARLPANMVEGWAAVVGAERVREGRVRRQDEIAKVVLLILVLFILVLVVASLFAN